MNLSSSGLTRRSSVVDSRLQAVTIFVSAVTRLEGWQTSVPMTNGKKETSGLESVSGMTTFFKFQISCPVQCGRTNYSLFTIYSSLFTALLHNTDFSGFFISANINAHQINTAGHIVGYFFIHSIPYFNVRAGSLIFIIDKPAYQVSAK